MSSQEGEGGSYGMRHLSCSAPRSQICLGCLKATLVVQGERVTDRGAVRWNNTKNESRASGLTHWVTHFLAQGCSEHPQSCSSHSSLPLFPFCGAGPRKMSLFPWRAGSRTSDLPLQTLDHRKGPLATKAVFNPQNNSPV